MLKTISICVFSGFLITCFVLILLRTVLTCARLVIGSKKMPFKYKKESVDWMNLIIKNIFSHFNKKNVLDEINQIVSNEVMRVNVMKLGNYPGLNKVQVISHANEDFVIIVLPIEWRAGPSLSIDHISSNINLYFALHMLKMNVMISWYDKEKIKMSIRLIDSPCLDFALDVTLGKKIVVPIMNIPLLGNILHDALILALSTVVIEFDVKNPLQ